MIVGNKESNLMKQINIKETQGITNLKRGNQPDGSDMNLSIPSPMNWAAEREREEV